MDKINILKLFILHVNYSYFHLLKLPFLLMERIQLEHVLHILPSSSFAALTGILNAPY